jgi:hypothetical protein
MAENKTQATEASVEDYLAAIDGDERRQDCETLVALMQKVTKEPPVLWGYGIVGFGRYHYRYESGREGDSSLAGFANRKGDISVYLVGTAPDQEELLARLGRHKFGKCCLYIRKLADIDIKILEKLVAGSAKEIKRLYPTT